MELNVKSFDEVIVGAEKELTFSIDADNSLIFEILRDKMYKDKIGSICREVLSNCRDANREAGSTEKIKVEIIEPDTLLYVGHQSVSFKDNGIGISPDRMADIYVKYTSSTKRGDNVQTGGFGLGAKTPFAYNDTFSVVTVCDYQGKRMKYYYTALIDATKKGKMILFDVEETTEPTGTEVIVPIKTPNDRREFEDKSVYYTNMWGCVEYVNFNRSVQPKDILLETDRYLVVSNDSTGLLIDGIPYPLDNGWGVKNLKLRNSLGVIMKFNTGELTLSANRESIQYDDDTVAKIKGVAAIVKSEFAGMLEDKIAGFSSYLEACKFKIGFSNYNPRSQYDNQTYVMLSALSSYRYDNTMLGHVDNVRVTYNGREVVSYVKFKHHNLYQVSETSKKVYSEMDSVSLINPHLSKIYYAKSRDSRRNKTLFEETSTFLILTPKTSSLQKDIDEELKTLKEDFEIHYHDFEAVERIALEKKKQPASRIAVRFNTDYYSTDSLYLTKDGKLFKEEAKTNALDLSKVCFLPMDNVARGLYSNTRDKINEANAHGYAVVRVNAEVYNKKISKCVGAKTLEEVAKEIYDLNYVKWLEEGKAYLLYEVFNCIPNEILEYKDVIPSSLIPKTLSNFTNDDMWSARNYRESYYKVRSDIKINKVGLERKFRKNFEKYPLLLVYLRHGSGDKTQNIINYIKQVDNYGN